MSVETQYSYEGQGIAFSADKSNSAGLVSVGIDLMNRLNLMRKFRAIGGVRFIFSQKKIESHLLCTDLSETILMFILEWCEILG